MSLNVSRHLARAHDVSRYVAVDRELWPNNVRARVRVRDAAREREIEIKKVAPLSAPLFARASHVVHE